MKQGSVGPKHRPRPELLRCLDVCAGNWGYLLSRSGAIALTFLVVAPVRKHYAYNSWSCKHSAHEDLGISPHSLIRIDI